jgi:hypothetical protein
MTIPTIWYVAPVLLVALGVIMLAAGLWHGARGRPVRGLYGVLSGAVLALGGLVIGVGGANLLTFTRLTYERPVADVSVQAIDAGDKRYTVTIRPLDGTARTVTCVLQGDEWILGARVQKWKPWVSLLGFDATYALDQVANKYASAAEANAKPITACDIPAPTPEINRYMPDPWLAKLTSYLQVEDRRFGSANYMPLADGATYLVVMTQTGLNAEPVNDAARAANSSAKP